MRAIVLKTTIKRGSSPQNDNSFINRPYDIENINVFIMQGTKEDILKNVTNYIGSHWVLLYGHKTYQSFF